MLTLTTLAVIISLIASPQTASASPVTGSLDKRTFSWAGITFSGTPLCQKPNYGASGVPWLTWTTPGAWCGKGSKPTSGPLWDAIPIWDGGDKAQCTWWNTWYTPVCWSTGNIPGSLPSGCIPPKGPSGPVCDLNYQVQYINYTTTANSGVYSGQVVGAAAQSSSYLTYQLSDTVDNCLKACDTVSSCVFVNTYYDVNAQETDIPKHKPGTLTCAFFSSCVSTTANNNWGGQDDRNSIVSSTGYCKAKRACGK